MRYSRIKRGRNQRRYAGVMVFVLLVIVGLYFLTAGTVGKYLSNFIGPILKSNQEGKDPGGQEPNAGNGSNNAGDMEFNLPPSENGNGGELGQGAKISETLKVEPMDFTIIQIGAFNDKENAESIARDLTERGGAGYIIDDQYLRVTAMAFHDRGSAEEVKNGLKGQSVEAQLYEIKCPGVDMDITAPREKIEGIKGAFEILKNSLIQMESIIKDLDNDKITGEMAINRLDETKKEMLLKAEELGRYSSTKEGSLVLGGLQELLSHQAEAMDEVVRGNLSDKVAISSKIKYTYIDTIVKYKTYIQGITKG